MNVATGCGVNPRRLLPGAGVVSLVCMLVLAGGLFTAMPALAAPSPPGPSALMASSSSLNFFSVDIHNNQPSQLSVTFNNYSPVDTTVAPATITGPDRASYSIGPDSCSGQLVRAMTGSCSLTVSFNVQSSGPGQKHATLELMDDNGTNTGTTLVDLSGTAITGTLSADQTSLTFDPQVIHQGNNSQQQVTIRNGLTAGVSINSVQIVGPDASSFNVQNNNCQGNMMGTNNTCQISVQFQADSAGTKTAQLEVNNDGTLSPLFVSLTGDGLNGPVVTMSPFQAIYGNVMLGSQTSQTFTLTNSGDAPLQIQGLFLIAGSPQVFPINNDGCSARIIAAGSSCQVTVGFVPIAAGVKDATLFLITNGSNPGLTTIGLSGTGVAPPIPPTGTGPAPTPPGTTPNPVPNDTVKISGTAQAGKVLTCATGSFLPGTRFSYQWLRNRQPIKGANAHKLLVGDADVGSTISCRVKATARGGSKTVTSPAAARTIAQLTIGNVSLHGFTITAKVTVSRGRLVTAGLINNGAFGARTLTIRAGGTYVFNLSPDAAARRALSSGRTLHVEEILALFTAHGPTPVLTTFNVIVSGKKTHNKH